MLVSAGSGNPGNHGGGGGGGGGSIHEEGESSSNSAGETLVDPLQTLEVAEVEAAIQEEIVDYI